ncbi:MAG: hypothetical protein EHM15_08250 [Desulfobacteraceae bacterium]|nr:MAG: hypothetical protein EHM15_08250 [Desulfobacteraceae bacterium]
MTETKKKIAAAIAAVAHYLEAEEAALQFAQPPAEAAPAGPKLWALNGRQVQMQLRNLMQLRALGRMG